MASDPREALALRLLATRSAAGMIEVIRAWALEPEQVERAAKAIGDAIAKGRGYRYAFHAAILALSGGDDGKA